MRKKNEAANKLALRREPLRRLTSAELSRVRGAESTIGLDTSIMPGHDSTTLITCNSPPTFPHASIPHFPAGSSPIR